MEGLPELPDPNPVLYTAELTGADMGEPFVRLVSSEIDSVTLDGFKFTGVDTVDSGRDAGVTTVTCTDEDGDKHFFMFRPGSDSPVTHISFKK